MREGVGAWGPERRDGAGWTHLGSCQCPERKHEVVPQKVGVVSHALLLHRCRWKGPVGLRFSVSDVISHV